MQNDCQSCVWFFKLRFGNPAVDEVGAELDAPSTSAGWVHQRVLRSTSR